MQLNIPGIKKFTQISFFYCSDLSAGRHIIESRIRKSVKRVTRCDIFTDGVLLEEDTNPDISAPFDVLLSCFTLECSCIDFEHFATALKNLSPLVRSGGGFILIGFSRGCPWKAGEYTFPHLKTDENDIRNALADAGFRKIEIKVMGQEGEKGDFKYKNFDKMFCTTAEKI